MKIIKLNEGVSYNEKTNSYDISFETDGEKDIINLVAPDIYQSDFLGNIYYFGYKINEGVSSSQKSKFFEWLKGLKDDKPTDKQYIEIIAKPLRMLDEQVGLKNFSLFVFPRSERSNLVQKMIEVCGMMTQRDLRGVSIELIKNLPEQIYFDWDLFDKNFTGDKHQREQIYNYIENEVMPRIHSVDYFSIAKYVKPKYRYYISNYLTASSGYDKDLMYITKSNKILIVNDINTSGATLTEIIRIIRNVNTEAEIYIFTLIGT